jgi:plasmid stabilization system protein ParE
MSAQRLRIKIFPSAMEEIAEQRQFYLLHATAEVAERWKTSVSNAIRSLRSLPERGSPVLSKSSHLEDLRRLSIDGFPMHFLLYRFEVESRIVKVIHVIHGARDLDALLGTGFGA